MTALAPAVHSGLSPTLRALIGALDRSIAAVGKLRLRTREGISKHSFASYYAYRAQLEQYSALEATIRSRLVGIHRDHADGVEEVLLASERRLLSITVAASLEFLFALSATPNLPLGTRELFQRELDYLRSSRDRLGAPEHDGSERESLLQDVETAQSILEEIMAKAPPLESFDFVPEAMKALPAPGPA